MTNQQWPQQGQSLWAQPDPNWQPPQFHEVAGRDPRQPFGQEAAPPPEVQFEPPRNSRRTLLVVLGVGVLVAALILGFQFWGAPSPADSASPSASAEPAPTATRTGNWIPFEGNGDGIFEVVSHEWTDTSLLVTVRVEVTRGEYNFALYAFENESRAAFEPSGLTSFTASVDEPYESQVEFYGMKRSDATIVLTTPSGNVQLNALPIPG